MFHYFLAALTATAAYLSIAPMTATVAILALVVLAGVVICGWLCITISMFNRPRFLVPPHLRGQPGALSRRSRPADRHTVRGRGGARG